MPQVLYFLISTLGLMMPVLCIMQGSPGKMTDVWKLFATLKDLNKGQAPPILSMSVNSITCLTGIHKDHLQHLPLSNWLPWYANPTFTRCLTWSALAVTAFTSVFIAAVTSHHTLSDKTAPIYCLTVLLPRSLIQIWADPDWLPGREKSNVYQGPTLCQVLW